MTENRLKVLVLVLTILVALGSSGLVTAQSDDWPDDDPEEVSFGTYSGQVSSTDDRDPFVIPVSKGQVIELELSKDAGDAVFTSVQYPGGSISLRNDDGTSSSNRITIEEDGLLEISVGGFPEGSSLPWTLTMEDTGERDQWYDTETPEESFGTHSGQVNSKDDRDPFVIPVSKGQVIALELSKNAGEQVFASVQYPGGSISLRNDDGTSSSNRITIEEDGLLKISVGGFTDGSSLSWTLTVADTREQDRWYDTETPEESFGTHSGQVNSKDDRDPFVIPVSKGQVVGLELSKDAGDQVFASVQYPGGSISLRNDDGTSSSNRITIEENGLLEISVGGFTDGSSLPWTVTVGEGSIETTTTTAEPTTTTAEPTTTTAVPTTTIPERTTAEPAASGTTTPKPTVKLTPITEADPDERSTETQTNLENRDSDNDGVIDENDYAPNDPEVQEKSDLQSDTSAPGFGFFIGIAALFIGTLLVIRRNR